MVQPVSDQRAFLAEAKKALEELSELKNHNEQLKIDVKKKERALEAERKAVTDEISLTIRKRMDEINSRYDQEIGKGQERLKKVRSKREKAKSQGVKERIEEETSELHAHNKELRNQMKSLFQKDHVPAYCNTRWYYAMYFTKGFSEMFIFLLNIIVCFLALPYGIYLLIPQQKPLYLVGIYFLVVVVFGGLYVFINNRTKVHHLKALKEGRAIRNVISSNNKKIRVITSTIKKDQDEALYDLKKYDDDIAKIEQELSEVAAKKKEALGTFETVTKTILADEITSNSKERIDALQEERDSLRRQISETEGMLKEKSFAISDQYESYIGREFMTPQKLDELAALIGSGKADNISEAINVYKSMKD